MTTETLSPPPKKRRRRRHVFFLLLLCLYLFGVLFGERLLNHLVDTESLSRSALQSVQTASGLKVEAKHFRLHPTLFNGLEAIWEDVTVSDPQSQQLAIAKSIAFNLRYIPLLSHRYSVSRIRLKHPELLLLENSYLYHLPLKQQSESQVQFEKTTLQLEDYRVTLKRPAVTIFEGRRFRLGPVDIGKPWQKGSVQLSSLLVRDPAHPQKLLLENVNGRLQFYRGLWLRVPKLEGRLNGHPFLLKGDIQLKKRWIKGHFQAQYLELAEIQHVGQHLFAMKPPWQAFQSTGAMDVNIQVKGSFENPSVKGHLNLKGLGLSFARTGDPLLQNLTGLIVLDQDQVRFSEITGVMDQASLTLKGVFRMPAQTMDVWVKTDGLNLTRLHQTLLALDVLPTEWGGLRLGGKLVGQAHLVGTLKKPALYGKLQLREGWARHEKAGLQVTAVSAQIHGTGHEIQIKSAQGALNQAPFLLHGVLSTMSKTMALQLQAEHVNVKPLLGMAQVVSHASIPLEAQGFANVTLKLNGFWKKPLLTGQIDLQGVQLTDVSRQLTLSGVKGIVMLTPDRFKTDQLQARLNQTLLTLKGSLQKTFKQYELTLDIKALPLSQLRPWIKAFNPNWGEHFERLNITNGTTDIHLSANTSLSPQWHGTVTLQEVALRHETYPLPVRITRLTYHADTGQLESPLQGVQVGELWLKIAGALSPAGARVLLESQRFPVSWLRDRPQFIATFFPGKLPLLYHTQGELQVKLLMTAPEPEITLHFFDAGASFANLKYPLYSMNGAVHLTLSDKPKLYTDKLAFRYANSPVSLSLDMNDPKDIYLETTGTLSPLLLNNWFTHDGTDVLVYAAIPFDLNVSGRVGQWTGQGTGNNLHAFFNMNIASLFADPNLEKPSHPGDDSLDQASLSSVLHLVNDQLKIEQTHFRVSQTSRVTLEGMVVHLFDSSRRAALLSIKTIPVLDLAAWAKKMGSQVAGDLSGTIQADLKWLMSPTMTGLYGESVFHHIHSANLQLEDLNGAAIFEGQQARMKLQHFQIPGVDVGFRATFPDLTLYPLPVTHFKLTGKAFNVTLYAQWISEVLLGKIRQGLWEKFFPPQGRILPLPFEIRDGSLQLAEGIVNNLIVEDFTSGFRLYPNTYFELDNVKAKSAGGTVTGHFAMSPRDNNFMSVHLEVEKVKANALSRILLNVSNQIFGNVSGVIDYTTEGLTNEDMLAHANGSATLEINDGRLPSVAKIENLLIAANTVSGGLANLNLNSVFRLATPFRTDYFARLAGSYQMVEGVLYTQDTISDGKSLDFKMSGLIRLTDGTARLRFQGEMEREVGGIFGAVGKLSIGRFLGFIPPLRKIISFIPGFGFVPGFGGPNTGKGVSFKVDILGPVLDPSSIKGFQWLQASTSP